MVFVWPALGVALIGVVGGLALAAVRALRTWRDVKRLKASVGEQVETIGTAAADIELHLTRAGESSERLSAALERLRVSRARLDVQLAALREARTSVERAVPFVGGR